VAISVGSLDWNWEAARRFLPFDLDGLAMETGALSRRRGVANGEALVRTLLLLALPNASLRRVALMAQECGLSKMNSTALFKRVRASERLLQALFEQTLQFSLETGDSWKDLRLIAVDGTCLCGPGATGTDQKLHTVYDLGKGLPLSVEITDHHGGEALWRHSAFGKGDLVLSDAGYGYNPSFLWALNSGARICIRFNFQTVTLFDEDGNRINADEINAIMPQEDALDIVVRLPKWEAPLRAVGSRNDEGEPVWLLTDLSEEELPTYEVRQLYRRRWQVELFFKRMKSLLNLDDLPTRDGPTVRPWIWAKLILASLATLMAHERFSPWGYPEKQKETQPLGDLRMRSVGHRKSPTPARAETQKRKAKRQKETTPETAQTRLLLEA
jgi:Transposase DDE domain